MGKSKRKASSDNVSKSSKHLKLAQLGNLAKYNYECRHRLTCDPKAYVTNIAVGRDESSSTIAAALSKNRVELYDLETTNHMTSIHGHKKRITDIKFSPNSPHHLLTSSLDGRICLWDVRSSCENPSLAYYDEENGITSPITTFDLNNLVVCAGTEVRKQHAYILFWDGRSSKILGSYWDSHVDEITQVRLNEAQPQLLATSSLDKLINIFDLNQPDETEALLHTLNTNSSVFKLSWRLNPEDEEAKMVTCITEDDIFQYWDCEEALPILHFSKDEIARLIKSNQVPSDYMVDTLRIKDTDLFATGSSTGNLALWTMESSPSLWAFIPSAHSTLVRTITRLKKKKSFLTGSEDGTIAIWSKKKFT